MTVQLRGVSARGAGRVNLTNVDLAHGRGVLGIIGSPKDGAALLLDLLSGAARPRAGEVRVLGVTPAAARARILHVSLDAPLPDALRVGEVCELAAEVRGGAKRRAREVLSVLGAERLADRRVRSLSVEERRVVALAIALGSDAEVLLVEEPLSVLDPSAPRLVVEALRARAATTCIVVTTASPRDAASVGDELGVLTAGVYTPVPVEDLRAVALGPDGNASAQIVVSPSAAARAGALVEALGRQEAVTRIDTSIVAEPAGAASLVVSARDGATLAKAITRAIGATNVDVELVEPAADSVASLRALLAAPRPAFVASTGAEAAAGALVPERPGQASLVARLRSLARVPVARLSRAPSGWMPIVGWSVLAVASALVARSSHPNGADHVLRGTFGVLILPLLVYGIVSAALGNTGLRPSVRGVVALGASRRLASTASVLIAMASSAVVAGLLAVTVCVIAHGPVDPPLVVDVPTSFGVALLGGAAYGAYFCAGSAFGRGAMRAVFLVADWLLGASRGVGSIVTPRGHVISLLGGPRAFDLSTRSSSVALVVLAAVYFVLAVRVSRSGSK